MVEVTKINMFNTDNEEKLKADLEKYRQMAVELGASDVLIIPTKDVVQKLRARMGDLFPRAWNISFAYFGPGNFDIPWSYAKNILSSYKYGIIAKIPYPTGNRNDFTGPTSRGSLGKYILPKYKNIWPKDQVDYWQAIQDRRQGARPQAQVNISKAIEEQARKDGHQFAYSGMSGGCIDYCKDFGYSCMALHNGICRNPGKSRPYGTAAAFGLDHPATYSKIGWENWVQGWSIFPEDYPDGPIEPPPSRTSIMLIE